MTLKNIDIINTMNFLTEMSEKKLPQKIGYAIVKNLMILKDEYDVYTKSLDKLIQSYNEHIIKDENGNPSLLEIGVPDVDAEAKMEYIKELNDLLSIDVDIDFFKIPESALDYDGDKYDTLSPKQIMLMMDIFANKEVE